MEFHGNSVARNLLRVTTFMQNCTLKTTRTAIYRRVKVQEANMVSCYIIVKFSILSNYFPINLDKTPKVYSLRSSELTRQESSLDSTAGI